MNGKVYLKGLNTLRFFAAFFVIISHGQISMWKMGLENYKDLPIFDRGADAVEFFFTLSGFLITYLLQKEINRTNTISIKDFYLRRVFRIWPLYFLVVFIGFITLGWIYPKLTGQHFFEFPVFNGLMFFIFFLPNLAASLYPVGMLYPLWSIGVEEQYYLFWAPLVKLFRKKIISLVIIFIGISYVWYYMLSLNVFHFSEKINYFLLTQKFYAMATGGLFGLILYKYPEQYKKSFFTSKFSQWIIFAAIVYYYVVGYPYIGGVIFHFFLSFLYGFLILNSSIIERPVINLEKQPFTYLGIISFGLYMYHMIIDYFLRFTILHFNINNKVNLKILMPFYHIALLGGTIIAASVSYKYFESYFLKLKESMHNKLHVQ
jgi:peptidoglycan/LPS O-acetylase OafA/YrhL